MNIDRPEKIYPSREAALAGGACEDQLVTGSEAALRRLQSKLLASSKRKRMRMRPKRGQR